MKIQLASRWVLDIRRPKISAIPHLDQVTEKKRILIACFPKSGSTYLAALLREITGFPRYSLVQCYFHNEQDILEARLKQPIPTDYVVQQHVKGGENNVRLIRKYNLKPVVLTRNLFDVVLSLHDHMERGDHRTPIGYVHQQYFSMKKEDKLMFIIRIMLPWYFNFLMSWYEASQQLDAYWTSYEKLFANQVEEVTKILTFCGITAGVEQINDAIIAAQKKKTRFNVGISGRRVSLTDAHRNAILEIARVWQVDNRVMDIIGIEL